MNVFHRTPSWLHRAALDGSQRGRWRLVCRVWTPAGRLTRLTQLNAENWVEKERRPRMLTFVPLISPLSLRISFPFFADKCLTHAFLSCVCVCFFLPLYRIYLPIFYLSLDSISHLSSSLSLSPSHLSASSQFLSWSNSMCTPGCRGNGGRPHKLAGEQKRPRDPLPQRDRKSNFIFLFFQRGEGRGTACMQRGKKMKRWWKGKRKEGVDGWIE